MKGDFTRDTFDPLQHFSRVLMQQGRVQLDADWNEQTAILLHYLRTFAADILGPHAGPGNAMGFDLITDKTIQGWTDEKWADFEPDPERRDILKSALETKADSIIGTGRYYVQGVLVENHRPILYTEQMGYPFSPVMELDNLQDKELLVYLDVWERHITYVQNEHLREVALGGSDTCTRTQVVWQVKILLPDSQTEQGTFNCNAVSLLMRKVLPRLRARARRSGAPSAELCSVSPDSQYRGLENQLYRVQVHEVAVRMDEAHTSNENQIVTTFKWSRDNGSVVLPIVSLSGKTVVVETLGRDSCALLQPGDWVEVCDDVLALREQSGLLARVEAVDRDELKITLQWPKDAPALPNYIAGHVPDTHPLLRRWDQAGSLSAYHGALPVVESTDWIDLEDGVQISFSEGGEFRVGDYWLIPARIATGDIEWPAKSDPAGMLTPEEQSPHGPKHYYAPLYHFHKDDAGSDVTANCRCTVVPARICESDEQ